MNSKIDEVLNKSRAALEAARTRIQTRLAGRSRQVMIVAAVAGVATVGLVAANLSSGPTPSLSSVAAEASQRANAADMANRSGRETPAASPSASTSPSAIPTPTKASPKTPTTKKATPSKTATTTKAAAAWQHPMPGAEVTSCFGQRWGVLHAGVDLAKPENTPIRAAGKGRVVAAGWAFSGYGISVMIDHGNGYLTHYAHMNKTSVSVGQTVSAGQTIGLEGSTGDSTGPHLHFEVHKGEWNQIEPTAWMRAKGVSIGC